CFLAGCTGRAPAREAVPGVAETLARVDRAIEQGRFAQAHADLDELIATVVAARDGGALEARRAEAILAAAAELLSALPPVERAAADPPTPDGETGAVVRRHLVTITASGEGGAPGDGVDGVEDVTETRADVAGPAGDRTADRRSPGDAEQPRGRGKPGNGAPGRGKGASGGTPPGLERAAQRAGKALKDPGVGDGGR